MGRVRHWILVFVTIGLILGGWWTFSYGQDAAPGALATDAGATRPSAGNTTVALAQTPASVLFRVEPTAVPINTATGESFPVTISRGAALAAARSGALSIALPDGTSFPVRYERSESAPGGIWTFIGRVDTTLGDLAAVITYGDDSVFGLLPSPDGSMMKLTTRAGQVYLQPAGSMVPAGTDLARYPDYVVPPPSGQDAAVGAAGTAGHSHGVRAARAATEARRHGAVGQRADELASEVTIDVLAAYTSDLVTLRGTANAVRAEYTNLVAVANQAHADSASRIRLKIVDFAAFTFQAGAWNHEVLQAVQEGSFPGAIELHAKRDAVGADLVAVIRPSVQGDPTCGIAYLGASNLQAYAMDPDYAFSVSAVEDCAPLVLAHELGHNLGLMHDRDTVAGQAGGELSYGAFPFSFGYRQDGPPAFATVMAYGVNDQVWVSRFSHPGSGLCEGAACGRAGQSDNVRSLNAIAGTASRLRDPPGTISVLDGWIVEPDADFAWGTLEIRLSTPAPAGGVSFDLVLESGTGELGVDAVLPSFIGLQDWEIQEGFTSQELDLRVLADDLVEGAETIILRLENVQGAVTVFDDEATLTIVDADTTVRLEGSVEFEEGVQGVSGDVFVYLRQAVDGVVGTLVATTSPPDFTFSFDVARGATAMLHVEPQLPFIGSSRTVEDVNAPVEDVRLQVKQGIFLTGTLRLTEASPGISEFLTARLWNAMGNGYAFTGIIRETIDGETYQNVLTHWHFAMPGHPMQLEVLSGRTPFVRQLIEIPPLYGDTVMDIELRDIPSLTIGHTEVVEGGGTDVAQQVQVFAELSVPAPAGGVTFSIETAGTAGADDFILPSKTFSIPEGWMGAEIPLVIYADDRGEGDEVVKLHITDIRGNAWSPGPGSVRIITDERRPDAGSCTEPVSESSFRMCH